MAALSELINTIVLGECESVLRTLPDECADAIVTDSPYALGTREPTSEDIDRYLSGARLDTGGDFMGYDWELPPVSTWRECLRVVKRGGYVVSFAGTRTWDLMDLGMRASGLTDENTFVSKFGSNLLQWVQGQGFPKSLNIAKAIRKLEGVPEQKQPHLDCDGMPLIARLAAQGRNEIIAAENAKLPISEAAKKWEGFGTALKPSWEPILVFRREGDTFVNPEIEAPFFYTGKATKSETNLAGESEQIDNDHPTRKPLSLMKWLVELTTPMGGLVIDPYVGSGTTAHAALEIGRRFIGIEMDPKFHAIATKRVGIIGDRREQVQAQEDLFALAMGESD